MAEQDPRRKAEVVIAGELKNFKNKTDQELALIGLTRLEADTLGSWSILVSRGGTDNPQEEAAVQEPPFVLVEAQEGEEVVSTGRRVPDGLENTWLVNLAVGYITNLDDVLPKDHSRNVNLLRKGIQAIRPGYDPVENFRLHGLDILGADDFEDKEKRARGDLFSIVVGCSG